MVHIESHNIKVLSRIPRELVLELNASVNSQMIIVFGSCSSIFDGRIKSNLDENERILIIKRDGTIILHDPIGLKPVQWQKPKAGKIKFNLTTNNYIQMETYRPKTDESFYIIFHEIHMALALTTTTKSSNAHVIGDEKDFVKYLMQHPEVIEANLKIQENEFKTEVGSIDILAKDMKHKTVIIEVKKAQATPADAHQLERYVTFYSKSYHKKPRGILVANTVPLQVKKHLKKVGLEYKELPWRSIFPTLNRPKSARKSADLTNFFH